MQNLHKICRIGQISLYAFAGWLTFGAMAFAKDTPSDTSSTSEGGGIWVVAYILVVLTFALGLMVVLKSNNRRERAKPEVYGEAVNPLDKNPQEKKK